MTSLAQYEHARTALAEATKIDEILSIRDEVDHVKLYAKQINDRVLLSEAAAFQMRVERKLGMVLDAAREAGQIVNGRPKKGGENTPFPRVTLEEVGVDKNLAKRARQMGSISEIALETMIEGMRERVRSGRAKIVDDVVPNGARAIMGSRLEPADSLDFFPTPPWATRALIEHVFPSLDLGAMGLSAWEPACGEGHMAEPLREYFSTVIATDIHDYDYGDQADFLDNGEPYASVDWIITNPPFGEAGEAFVLKALDLAKVGVAMFMRVQWLDTIGRYERIFRDIPPTLIAFFAERVPLCKGHWDPMGSTATAYMWLVWVEGQAPRAPFWIPPGCREALTKPDDIARFAFELPPHDPITGEIIETEGQAA